MASIAPFAVPSAGRRDHRVGFYRSDAYLAGAVADHLAPALVDAGLAVVIATPEHHAAISVALVERGLDPVAAGERYLELDAGAVLESICRDGAVDAEGFDAVIGGLLRGRAVGDRPVHAYGEMVTLLWERGDTTGALALEELWNELGSQVPFELFCSYPTSAFEDDLDIEAFRAVCDAHSLVLPSESLAVLTDTEEQVRTVALLEQQTVAAGNERAMLRAKQQELEAALEQLAEADRLRRRFTAMVVHDLQSPTAVISGVLEQLRGFGSDLSVDEAQQFLGLAERSAERIQRLVDDVLLMSRLEAGGFTFDNRTVDLGRIVTELVHEVRHRTGRTIELTIQPDLPATSCDEGRQQQILDNLLSNALKFSATAGPVSVHLSDGGTHVIVRIEDHGKGIAPSALEQLFRPFSRHEGAAGGPAGTGLGLYITRSLVEGQGGEIGIASELGEGTTLTYTVPVASPA